MSNLMSSADGNFTAAGSWSLLNAAANAFLDSQAASTASTTSYVYSAVFQPGAVTVDGVGVKIAARAGSPTGTFTVQLYNNTAAAEVANVVINVSDIDTNGEANGWYFFKFTPALLIVANDYKIGIRSSTASQVTLYRNSTAGNWSRMVRETANQAPAAGDRLFIMGEWTAAGAVTTRTITMDSTAATDYGDASTSDNTPSLSVGKSGTLTWGTTAATNYLLRVSGYVDVRSGGTWNMGTSGTPMPRNSSAVLEFDCAADGDFGFVAWGGSTVNIYGLSRTVSKEIYKCKLNTDEAAAQTVLGVDTDTGWLDADEIAIAPTARTYSQYEKRTMTGAATATEITVTAGLTNAHSGTSPTQAEVILLTRNVKIRSVTSTLMTFCRFDNTAVVAAQWVEFYYMGGTAADEQGVVIKTTTGSCNLQYCSFHDFEAWGVYINASTANNITLSNNVLYLMNSSAGASRFGVGYASVTTQTSNTISNNTLIGFLGTTSAGFDIGDANGTFTNNTATGCQGRGMWVSETGASSLGTISGNTSHTNGGVGFDLQVNDLAGSTISTLTCWRNAAEGFVFSGTLMMNGCTFDTFTMFGNTTSNIEITGNVDIVSCVWKNLTLSGDSSFATTNNILFTGTAGLDLALAIENSNLSTVTGIKVVATNDINLAAPTGACRELIRLYNTDMGGTNEVTSAANLYYTSSYPLVQSQINSSKHDQTVGKYKSWFKYGTIETNTTTFNTAAPSSQMSPISAGTKLESQVMCRAVASGSSVTVNVYVRKNAAYNGNAPRLINKKGIVVGVTADTVVDTLSVGIDTWELLTGTVGPASADSVYEFVVDCDGTAGSVFVDDWSFTNT